MGNLRELYMGACKSLLSLPDSFCDLSNLTKLAFCDWGSGCEKLESLPERFGQLKSLVTLNLAGCTSLEALPVGIPTLTSSLPLHFCMPVPGPWGH